VNTLNERLLVTGGAGFIGANFVHHWLAGHPQSRVVVLDALTYAGNRVSLRALEDHPGFRFVHGNICDSELVSELLRSESLDTLVHFAAESHVDRSITGPDAFIETNVVGTHSLLRAARDVWLAGSGTEHRFHHVSTDEVYGSLGDTDPAFHEEQKYEPSSPYSASKAASDHLVRAYHQTYGLQVTTSNCSNNYGPFHFPEKLIPLCLTNLLRGLPLPVYGEGKNVRDWLYVEDHCRGIELVLNSGRVGGTYNIGGNNEWTNIDIVKLLCSLLDKRFAEDHRLAEQYPDAVPARGQNCDSVIEFVTDRPGHDWRYAIDAGKITTELGYQPAEDFPSGIDKTLDWYLDNRAWWEPLLG
jgi:dTDP-glucose 4,6-dehydratase